MFEERANCSINIPRPHKKYVTPKRDPFAYFPQEMEPKISAILIKNLQRRGGGKIQEAEGRGKWHRNDY